MHPLTVDVHPPKKPVLRKKKFKIYINLPEVWLSKKSKKSEYLSLLFNKLKPASGSIGGRHRGTAPPYHIRPWDWVASIKIYFLYRVNNCWGLIILDALYATLLVMGGGDSPPMKKLTNLIEFYKLRSWYDRAQYIIWLI